MCSFFATQHLQSRICGPMFLGKKVHIRVDGLLMGSSMGSLPRRLKVARSRMRCWAPVTRPWSTWMQTLGLAWWRQVGGGVRLTEQIGYRGAYYMYILYIYMYLLFIYVYIYIYNMCVYYYIYICVCIYFIMKNPPWSLLVWWTLVLYLITIISMIFITIQTCRMMEEGTMWLDKLAQLFSWYSTGYTQC